MKVARLTEEQTMWIPEDADVYIPAHRGPGAYTICENCSFILYSVRGDSVDIGCRMSSMPHPICPELHLKL